MTIAELREAGKRRMGQVPRDILIIAVLVLSATASFGLGVLAGRDMGQGGGGVWIEDLPQGGAPALGVAAAEAAGPAATITAGGQVVASKNGTKYYLPWCGGAKNISEANKVWFDSADDAQAHGYTSAANCKGL